MRSAEVSMRSVDAAISRIIACDWSWVRRMSQIVAAVTMNHKVKYTNSMLSPCRCVVSTPSPQRTSPMTPLRRDELGVGSISSDQVSVASADHYLPLVNHDD